MTQEGGSGADERLLRRHRLRIRTVAVTFEAALASAAHSFLGAIEEREELVDRWRSWSLDQLAAYRSDLDALRGERPDLADAVAELLAELERTEQRVRGA
ncbi:MAG TPA: hypothetical protein VHR55_00825 [Candidatus Limnocylindria bacterium]|nr:hypothetical protein [Candidatus Limnocylindria bacterium]